MTLPNGIQVLREALALKEVMLLVERTARWVAPETFKLLPVWYPEYARGMHLSTGGWTFRRLRGNSNPALETNVQASKALTTALGLRSADRRGWTCCHIWGVDDPNFRSRNEIIRDHRFYSCIGNMVLLPDPLKAFTDSVPEVKLMLRLCARNLYGRTCGPDDREGAMLDVHAQDDAYPPSWPRQRDAKLLPMGTMPLTNAIRAKATARLSQIRRDLQKPGALYPKQEVENALREFHINT